MKKTIYLTAQEVLEIHRLLITHFGGREGLRDRGLLESALFRPQTGYYDSLYTQAASLLQSLCHNHPFVDGNRRIAWTVTKTFLLVNGSHLTARANDAEKFLIEQVIKKKIELEKIAAWLEKRCKPI